MPPRKPKSGKSQTPQQTTFIEPVPQVKNSDILDVDETAILLKVSKKTIYRQSDKVSWSSNLLGT